MVNGGGFPLHKPLAVESRLGGQGHLEVSISAVKWKWSEMKLAISAKMDNEKILGEGLCDFTHFAKVF